MATINFNVKISRNLTSKFSADTKRATQRAIRTVVQDLARTSSEAAPHLTGDLEDSYSTAYQSSGGVYYGTVEFAVYKGNFNYAIAMHEWTYNLGAGSRAKSGGTGMSGNHYAVGRKYLTRVLEGEAQAYKDYIGTKIKEQLQG